MQPGLPRERARSKKEGYERLRFLRSPQTVLRCCGSKKVHSYTSTHNVDCSLSALPAIYHYSHNSVCIYLESRLGLSTPHLRSTSATFMDYTCQMPSPTWGLSSTPSALQSIHTRSKTASTNYTTHSSISETASPYLIPQKTSTPLTQRHYQTT